MIINKLKSTALSYYRNIGGWKTDRKIVLIESDDWGSIRMPSREVYENCLKEGYRVDLNAYERYDSLASEDDLELLFDLLTSFKDFKGNNPVITANCVVANPDFEKIKKNHFKKYYYELVTETFRKYPKHSRCFDLWRIGRDEKIFFPQFHAREHVNVSKFMRALQDKDPDVFWGFQNQMPGSIKKGEGRQGNDFVTATLYDSDADKLEKLAILLDGLNLFKGLFTYKSESITPPNYLWSNDFNKPIAEKGVKYIQGINETREPNPLGRLIKHGRKLGQRNKFNQIQLIRNCRFEPSLVKNPDDELHRCLQQINIAFQLKKPAIISSHRINFVGYLDLENRNKNLIVLNKLLYSVLLIWPEVEFLTSVDLGNIISQSKTEK